MQLPVFLLMMTAAAHATVSKQPPSDAESRRFEIVVPPNDFFYQSFTKSQPAFAVIMVMFLFPDDRLITQFNWMTISGTGSIRQLDGGIGTNVLIIRVESEDTNYDYRVDFNTIPVPTTTTTTTTEATTTESEATTTESEATTTESKATTTEYEATTTTTKATTTYTEPTSTESESTSFTELPSTTCLCTCD